MEGYRSSGLVYALRKQGIYLEAVEFPESGYFPRGWLFRRSVFERRKSIWLVTYPNARYVFFLKMLGCRKIILDAGWPTSDFSFEREVGFYRAKLKRFLSYSFDYLTFNFSQVVLLESRSQVEHCAPLLHTAINKLNVIPTSLDERSHSNSVSVKPADNFTILFRGRFNPESGVEVLLDVAQKLIEMPFRFLLLCPNLPNSYRLGSNIVLDRNFYTQSELSIHYKSSHIVLGQLASHPRLERTVPHRAIEAAYSGSIFVTGRNAAVSEFFTENQDCLMFSPGSAEELCELLICVFEDYSSYKYLGENILSTYKKRFSPKVIARDFIGIVDSWV